MKRIAILALAVLLVAAFTVPAAALENQFGGYWRTRFYRGDHFTGSDDVDVDKSVDTRTRLYYTAKINDNLKLVNKFEMDATWGSGTGSRNNTGGNNRGYGQVSADGANIEIKNSYADFNLGPVNMTVGVQPFALFRSFYIDDDASGLVARWKAADNFVLAASWLKAYEGGTGNTNDEDIDSYTLSSAIYFSENVSLKPSISWAYSDEVSGANAAGYLGYALGGGGAAKLGAVDDNGGASIITYGADFDMKYDGWGLWATAVGQYGELHSLTTTGGGNNNQDIDFRGYLFGVGANVMLGPVDLHGQTVYASGDDDVTDDTIDSFFNPNASYYWSEIMGYGIFDAAASANSVADKVRNIWFAGVGVSGKPTDKLKIGADLWYAKMLHTTSATNNATDEDVLGTELDVVVTYQLVEGLNLDLVGAYLWADDGTINAGDNNKEDPYEIGARLSLSF
jgi:hypothetical protein